jgi:hypothetical protein
VDNLKFGNQSLRYPKRGGALRKGSAVRPKLGGRGLAALLLASAASVILVAPFTSASAQGWGGGHPGSGGESPGWGWHSGGGGGGGSPQPPSKQCGRDDWRDQHPWLCDEPTTTTQPPHVEVTTTTASTTPTTVPTTTPTTAPGAKPPGSNPPGSSSGGSSAGANNASGGQASAQALGQPSLALTNPPAAVVRPPQAVPEGPFGWPPLGGGLDDSGMPTGFLIVIGIAGAAAALMVVRGGFGHRPFLSVPDDPHRTLPFE